VSAAAFNPYAYYNPAADTMRGGWGGQENAAGRLNRWLSDAQNLARSRGYTVDPAALQRLGLGGIRWAEENEGKGTSGFNWGGYGSDVFSNTYNPGEAVEYLAHGTNPTHAGVWGTAGQESAQTAAPALGDWLSGHNQIDPTQALYFNTNPGLYWRWAGQSFSPTVASPRTDWWNNRYQQAQADYGVASAGDPNLTFVDYLNRQYPALSAEFGLLPAAQRGVDAPYLPAGRPQL
jgi:hypothetical protein